MYDFWGATKIQSNAELVKVAGVIRLNIKETPLSSSSTEFPEEIRSLPLLLLQADLAQPSSGSGGDHPHLRDTEWPECWGHGKHQNSCI